jgi:hypothetical protein
MTMRTEHHRPVVPVQFDSAAKRAVMSRVVRAGTLTEMTAPGRTLKTARFVVDEVVSARFCT